MLVFGVHELFSLILPNPRNGDDPKDEGGRDDGLAITCGLLLVGIMGLKWIEVF